MMIMAEYIRDVIKLSSLMTTLLIVFFINKRSIFKELRIKLF